MTIICRLGSLESPQIETDRIIDGKREKTKCVSRTFSVPFLLYLYSLFLAYTNIWVPENEFTGVGWTF